LLHYLRKYEPALLSGLETTLLVSIGALLIAGILGLAIASLRMSAFRPARTIAIVYIDIFRSTPTLVQLLFGFYVLPIAIGVQFSAQTTGIVVLGIAEAAYFAEIYRSGIETVPEGQRDAARGQGMSSFQMMRRVVLPQAVRRVLPQLTSMTISLVKDSSLVSALGVADLMYKVNTIAAVTLDPLPLISLAAMLYALISFPLAIAGILLHRRFVRTIS
jgi:His/Glu/Gln/Arg/opine family amino acid ABC transporter permease subunit